MPNLFGLFDDFPELVSKHYVAFLKGDLKGGHPVDEHSESPEVYELRVVVALHNLGGEVDDRPRLSVGGLVGREQLRQSEVGQFAISVFENDYILGL